VHAARGGAVGARLPLGEFDGIEVGRVFGEENALGADGSDGGAHGLASVGSEIVHSDDVARTQDWTEHLFDMENIAGLFRPDELPAAAIIG
jgi:hypothetical protein